MKVLKIIFIILLSSKMTFAQQKNDSLFSLKIKDLVSLFSATNYAPLTFSDTNITVLRAITSKQNSKITNKSNYLQKKKELLDKDYGLQFTGSYLENFNPDVADLNDNLVYTRKFQAGINWQVLKNGYFDNQINKKLLDDRIEREKLKSEVTNQSAYYLKRFDQTIYVFNKLKITLLNQREKALLKQYSLIEELVLLKKLPKQDLIKIETRLVEIQSLKNVYASYNNYLNLEKDTLALNIDDLPLIDLNYDAIFGEIENQTKSIIEGNSYVNYYRWYHQIGLKTFVKYNYYDLIASNNRDYFSAGLNITIPLPLNTKLKNEVAQEKWKYDNEQLLNNRNSLHEEVLNVAYEFRYKLKQFIAFYQKRKIIEEKLRIEQVKARLGDKNMDPMGGLDIVDDIVRVDIELIDLLQNMYLKAIKIQSKIPYSTIDQIVKTESMASLNKFAKSKQKGIYVWSKSFVDYSTDFLTEYVIYNGFKKVIVSASINDSLIKKKTQFANYLKGEADFYAMIGSNKLFYDKNIVSYIDRTIKSYKGITNLKGIHLDIEPQTFNNWKTDRQKLLQDYLMLVSKISKYCRGNKLKLEISIPLYYDTKVVNDLFDEVDKIYFMCYENVKNEYIAKKLKPYTDQYLNKIEIAIRTEDFNDRIEMSKKTEALENITKVKFFTYHDLNRLIALDKASLKR